MFISECDIAIATEYETNLQAQIDKGHGYDALEVAANAPKLSERFLKGNVATLLPYLESILDAYWRAGKEMSQETRDTLSNYHQAVNGRPLTDEHFEVA